MKKKIKSASFADIDSIRFLDDDPAELCTFYSTRCDKDAAKDGPVSVVKFGMLCVNNTYMTRFKVDGYNDYLPDMNKVSECLRGYSIHVFREYNNENNLGGREKSISDFPITEEEQEEHSNKHGNSSEDINESDFKIVFTPCKVGHFEVSFPLWFRRNGTTEEEQCVDVLVKANVLDKNMGKPMLRRSVVEISRGDERDRSDIESDWNG